MIYAVLLFALVKLIPITLTLPGIAGLILTLAVAADANIVIFERIKEEVRAGRSIPAAISAGYSKALRTIIDANVVTIGVAFILFMLATAGVKGFAFTLGVGTIVSLFTAVLVTSAILGLDGRARGCCGARSRSGVSQEEGRGWTLRLHGQVEVVLLDVGRDPRWSARSRSPGSGINFGIDFESGTRIKTPLEQPASVDDVRDALAPLGYGDAKIQEVDEPRAGRERLPDLRAAARAGGGDGGRARPRRGVRRRAATTSQPTRSARRSASRSRAPRSSRSSRRCS